jgi:hypothetical protein
VPRTGYKKALADQDGTGGGQSSVLQKKLRAAEADRDAAFAERDAGRLRLKQSFESAMAQRVLSFGIRKRSEKTLQEHSDELESSLALAKVDRGVAEANLAKVRTVLLLEY